MPWYGERDERWSPQGILWAEHQQKRQQEAERSDRSASPRCPWCRRKRQACVCCSITTCHVAAGMGSEFCPDHQAPIFPDDRWREALSSRTGSAGSDRTHAVQSPGSQQGVSSCISHPSGIAASDADTGQHSTVVDACQQKGVGVPYMTDKEKADWADRKKPKLPEVPPGQFRMADYGYEQAQMRAEAQEERQVADFASQMAEARSPVAEAPVPLPEPEADREPLPVNEAVARLYLVLQAEAVDGVPDAHCQGAYLTPQEAEREVSALWLSHTHGIEADETPDEHDLSEGEWADLQNKAQAAVKCAWDSALVMGEWTLKISLVEVR